MKAFVALVIAMPMGVAAAQTGSPSQTVEAPAGAESIPAQRVVLRGTANCDGKIQQIEAVEARRIEDLSAAQRQAIKPASADNPYSQTKTCTMVAAGGGNE